MQSRAHLVSSTIELQSCLHREILGARLGSQSHRRVRYAEQIVAPAFDDLEEEAILVGCGVDVKKLAGLAAVVEDAEIPEPVEQIRSEIVAGAEIVVIIFRDFQEADARGFRALDAGKDV